MRTFQVQPLWITPRHGAVGPVGPHVRPQIVGSKGEGISGTGSAKSKESAAHKLTSCARYNKHPHKVNPEKILKPHMKNAKKIYTKRPFSTQNIHTWFQGKPQEYKDCLVNKVTYDCVKMSPPEVGVEKAPTPPSPPRPNPRRHEWRPLAMAGLVTVAT